MFTNIASADILSHVNAICDMPVRLSTNSGASPYFTVLSDTRQENKNKPPDSTLMDIALLVAGTDYYHLE